MSFPAPSGNGLVRSGSASVADRQLGLAYGAGAVRALEAGEDGAMMTFQAPDMRCIPLTDCLNRIRTLTQSSELIKIARSLGIAFGDRI